MKLFSSLINKVYLLLRGLFGLSLQHHIHLKALSRAVQDIGMCYSKMFLS